MEKKYASRYDGKESFIFNWQGGGYNWLKADSAADVERRAREVFGDNLTVLVSTIRPYTDAEYNREERAASSAFW